MINIDDRILEELNESEMFLVLQIAKRMKHNRMTAWPSLDTLAKDCKWDERTVKRWRDSLITKGYLDVKLQPGKATIYRFKKKGIGVFQGIDNEYGYSEQEGTKNEGGAKNERVQNLSLECGQEMYPQRVQKMYPEVFNKEVVNNSEEVNKSFPSAAPLAPPFEKVGEIEFPESVTIPLEAKKEKTPQLRGTPKKEKKVAPKIEIPESLNTPEFVEVWSELLTTPKWRKKTEVSLTRCLKSLSEYEAPFAITLVKCSVSNGWQGVVFDNTPQKYADWKKSHSGHTAPTSTNPPGRSTIQWAGGDMSKYDEVQKF